MDFLSRKRQKIQVATYKIHGTPASTANVPLLNLNLNYEKLPYKGRDI